MGELNATQKVRKQKSAPGQHQGGDQSRQGPETSSRNSLRHSKEIQKEQVNLFARLVTYARKHKLAKVTFGDISFELTGQSFLSRKEQKEIRKLINPSPEDQRRQHEEDLYYSSL